MTFFTSRVIYIYKKKKKKNVCGYLYKSCNGLKKIHLNWFGGKLYLSAVNTTGFHRYRE